MHNNRSDLMLREYTNSNNINGSSIDNSNSSICKQTVTDIAEKHGTDVSKPKNDSVHPIPKSVYNTRHTIGYKAIHNNASYLNLSI